MRDPQELHGAECTKCGWKVRDDTLLSDLGWCFECVEEDAKCDEIGAREYCEERGT